MTPFYTRFPELAAQETRCAHVLQAGGPLPVGEYGCIELYCDEDDCDCRRVLLQVSTPQAPRTVLATINYGWESIAFCTRWMHGDAEAGREIAEACLDPLNPQSKHALVLLDLFRDIVGYDPAYIARLARHYEMFKHAPGYQPCRPGPPVSETIRASALRGLDAATERRDGSRPAAHFEPLDDLMQEGYDLLESHRAAAAAFLRRVLPDPVREHFLTLFLDQRNQVTGYYVTATGTAASCPVGIKEVFQAALVSGATSILVAHNHTSMPNEKDIQPSAEDVAVTRRLCDAGELLGIPIIDHLILGQTGFYSFHEHGRMPPRRP